MGQFDAFQNILPDPNNYLSEAGSANTSEAGASLGPGFVEVKFSAKQPVMMTRTNSGRVITRSVAAHSWNIGITYNSLTRAEFEPVFSFKILSETSLFENSNPKTAPVPLSMTSG